MKIRPVEAELFYAKGRTEWAMDGQMYGQKDMTKIIVGFRKF